MSERVLVIGAGGFVGTALTKRLLTDGHTVHRPLRTPSVSSGIRDLVHIGNLDDADLLRDILLDCLKLHSELGWSPAVPLSDGIKRTWRWLESQPL